MFSWITGPRITNVIEDIQPESTYENTLIEPPETPAHQFAVKAFKHALFGTPAPEITKSTREPQKKTATGPGTAEFLELPAPQEGLAPVSPSKSGILRTPGNAVKGTKTVSFGAHVVDNEGKRSNVGRSGIPNDCPGKFPSPWTPGTELRTNPANDQKPRTKLTEALYGARTVTHTKSSHNQRSKDDVDITLDMDAPRSESGKYWKEQYELYASKSEQETKKLVQRQQLAKSFAKKKDAEAIALRTKLEEERKRYRRRLEELEAQNKLLQEQLRLALEESSSANTKISTLKSRVSSLEKLLAPTSSYTGRSRMPFEIYEDPSKDTSPLWSDRDEKTHVRPQVVGDFGSSSILGNPVHSARGRSKEKENSPPKARQIGRQTLPATSTRPTPSHSGTPKVDVGVLQEPTISPKSPLPSTQPSETSAVSAPAMQLIGVSSDSPLNVCRPLPCKENVPPMSPVAIPSSPLPQPSPDPWVQDFNNSPLPQMDRMALPISSGLDSSRPAKLSRSVQPSHHRATLSASQVSKLRSAKAFSQFTEKQDPKLDISKAASHHIDASSIVTRERERVDLPVDRKAEAKRRLMERKQRRQAAS